MRGGASRDINTCRAISSSYRAISSRKINALGRFGVGRRRKMVPADAVYSERLCHLLLELKAVAFFGGCEASGCSRGGREPLWCGCSLQVGPGMLLRSATKENNTVYMCSGE